MRKETLIDLITRDADGLLSTWQKRRLDRYLASDPEAGKQHEQMLKISGLLKKMNPPESTPDLPEKIMEKVRELVPPKRTPGTWQVVREWLVYRSSGQAIPLRLASAVGVAAVVVVLAVHFASGPLLDDTSRVSATLVTDSRSVDSRTASCRVDYDNVDGLVEARYDGESIRLVTTITAPESISLHIETLPSGDMASAESRQENVTVLSHPGDGTQITKHLPAPTGEKSAELVIRISARNGRGHEYRLHVPTGQGETNAGNRGDTLGAPGT